MSAQRLFRGCATALATPFTNEETLDLPAFRALIERQLAGGVSALVVCGTTGEPSTMTAEEQDALVSAAVDQARGRVPVIAGTGGNCTRAVIARARRCRELGADAQLCVTPYYNKTTQEGLFAHFSAIARDGALPVILYNVPSRTGLNMLPETVRRLAETDGVLAVKEACADVAQAADAVRLCGDRIAFYSGMDEIVVPLMALGYEGVISVVSNLVPERVSRMAADFLRGDIASARAEQLALLPLVRALFAETSPIPLKAAMARMGLCGETLRLPLTPASDAVRARLFAAMDDAGL